jgi:DNA-binding NtrC family response regulator
LRTLKGMEQFSTTFARLMPLLDESCRPIYAIDAERQIAYCNKSLATWTGLRRGQIVGKPVEYHSVPSSELDADVGPAPLTELCPPPVALAGMQCEGTVAITTRNGRLLHRKAEFLPLSGHDHRVKSKSNGLSDRSSVLVVLASTDMMPEEISAQISAKATPDELHRAIRRFRHAQAEKFGIESLLGTSTAMEKVRAQIAAASADRANVIVAGRSGSGRSHVARAVHYQGAESTDRLYPIECVAATEDQLRLAFRSARASIRDRDRTTILLLELQRLNQELQERLQASIREGGVAPRIIATVVSLPGGSIERSDFLSTCSPQFDRHLWNAISTITIEIPALADRLEDLPLLAQSFLEEHNRGRTKQIGAIHPDALDLLALYSWPGELKELGSVMAAAHTACTGHAITPADLPPVIHHAAKTAALPQHAAPERIVLDAFMASIERELIERAMTQSAGNKTAAAELLGMTRPRLYRRLVQLGLVSDSTVEFHEDTSQ